MTNLSLLLPVLVFRASLASGRFTGPLEVVLALEVQDPGVTIEDC